MKHLAETTMVSNEDENLSDVRQTETPLFMIEDSKKRKSIDTASALPDSEKHNGHIIRNSKFFVPRSDEPGLMTEYGIVDVKELPRNNIAYCILPNGEIIQPNDFVFISPYILGEPLQIARVISFEKSDIFTESAIFDMVRLNWYFRPRDIQRNSSDNRLLFASMHSDLYNVAYIKGKCIVTHRSCIENLDEYRKLPLHFYYERLFDQNISRIFDLVPTSQAKNLPYNALSLFMSKYDYLVCEYGKSRFLFQAPTYCKTCAQWCAPDTSVCCSICKSTFHMHCLVPPLTKQPPHGFAWACAACSYGTQRRTAKPTAKIIRNKNGKITLSIKTSGTASPSPTPTDVPMKLEEKEVDVKLTIGEPSKWARLPWNIRFVNIRKASSESPSEDRFPALAKPKLTHIPGTSIKALTTTDEETSQQERSNKIQERHFSWLLQQWPSLENAVFKGLILLLNNDSCPACMVYLPTSVDEQHFEEYLVEVFATFEEKKLYIPLTFTVNIAMEAFFCSNFENEPALKLLKDWLENGKPSDSCDAESQEKLFSLFATTGFSLAKAAEQLEKHIGIKDVILCFLKWKASTSGANALRKLPCADLPEVIGFSEVGDPGRLDCAKLQKIGKPITCRWCGTKRSDQWFVEPSKSNAKLDAKTVPSTLCNVCGSIWRVYATSSHPDQQALVQHKSIFEVDVTRRLSWSVQNDESLAKTHHDSHSPVHSLKPNQNDVVLEPKHQLAHPKVVAPTQANRAVTNASLVACCNFCGLSSLEGMLRCSKCGLFVHEECYFKKDGIASSTAQPEANGVRNRSTRSQSILQKARHQKQNDVEKGVHENWLCASCSFTSTLTITKHQRQCILCHRPFADLMLKDTFEMNWVHVVCATWTPGVALSTYLNEPIWGIGSLPPELYEGRCSICYSTAGVTIPCCTCGARVHSSCALKNNWHLVFEAERRMKRHITAAEAQLKSFNGLVDYGTESAATKPFVFRPVVYCPLDEPPRSLFRRGDIFTLTKRVVWQEFISSCTQRMPYRIMFDSAACSKQNVQVEDKTVPSHSCSLCHETVSPFWWPGDICHFCFSTTISAAKTALSSLGS
ncbi:Lid2 complex subunit Snt2 [Schizosaccharomyces japonicus yFS275]|uniref:Lid2 complex subunit Snt2 n=1 Tax=Schizosaccharomyces japonicus (strain yFS275 / FY16936) TaxID=402676 RepID=B6K437_SCHJY|nr:Lid2 complex subunit Snt2 [Schizosaccharomyces japonicus yFS275]EEB08244.1 Lid2 complex subunit Snt2 [Schizosaccharomyces japonicus yFS275]